MERGTMPTGRGQPVLKNPLHTTRGSIAGKDGMIWFFIAGMIAGAVGWHLFVTWYGRKLERERIMEAFKKKGEDGK